MAAIKALYVQLGLEQRFRDYEATSHARLEVRLHEGLAAQREQTVLRCLTPRPCLLDKRKARARQLTCGAR